LPKGHPPLVVQESRASLALGARLLPRAQLRCTCRCSFFAALYRFFFGSSQALSPLSFLSAYPSPPQQECCATSLDARGKEDEEDEELRA
jgi:hypothetical protein